MESGEVDAWSESPDALSKQLFGGSGSPAAIGCGTGWAGVEDAAKLNAMRCWETVQGAGEFCLGESANPDHPGGFERLQNRDEMRVAGGLYRGDFGCGDFVWRDVAACSAHEHERAVIDHKVIGEEGIGSAETLRK